MLEQRPARSPLPFRLTLRGLACLLAAGLAAPLAAEQVPAFPAFTNPPGELGAPTLHLAGDDVWVSTGAPGNHLYRFDPQTFVRALVSPASLEPVAVAGGRLIARDLLAGQLVAVDGGSVIPLGVSRPTGPFTVAEGLAFFTDLGVGQKLWQTDGTPAGTRVLADLDPVWPTPCQPGAACSLNLPSQIALSGDRVFFDAQKPGTGRDLFAFDRDSGAIEQLDVGVDAFFFDLEALPDGDVAYLALVSDLPAAISRFEAWVSAGGENRRILAFDIPYAGDPALNLLHVLGDRLLIAVPAESGYELWAWHPGLAAAEQIAGFAAPPQEMLDHGWKVVDGHIFFPADGEEAGAELWSSDGTAAGTVQVKDLAPGSAGSRPHDLLALPDGRVVFAASHPLYGEELFISNGKPEGTLLLADVEPGTVGSEPSDFVLHGSRLFFQARTNQLARRLFYLELPPRACPEDRLCLGGDRFEAKVEVVTPDGTFAGRRELALGDSGVFSFFSAGNWEMLVKVLDGCTLNDRFWVFSAAATDVEYTLTVTDRANGETYTHHHPAGEPAPALADTDAFATCGELPPEPYEIPTTGGSQEAPVCDDGEAYCFGGLKVRVDWKTAGGEGAAKASAYGTPQSGLFSFFSPDNQEMLVKVLDACAINGRRWLFAAAATDLEFTLKVRNSFNPNENRDYHHPAGSPAPAIIDLTSYGQGCP